MVICILKKYTNGLTQTTIYFQHNADWFLKA